MSEGWQRCRFANHANHNNSYAKVMLVNGEHRVAMYAKIDMPAGTEILYDYGYHSATDGFCPKWGGGPEDRRLAEAERSKSRSRSNSRAREVMWGDAAKDQEQSESAPEDSVMHGSSSDES